ncbi:MAG TPA: type VI secretion system contractile sheath large subunit [Candidatus Sulfopaludibacter sp.]|jgi:type VI secretion system protein ImpC|nr:type VI secretion system contractile sheath large subunit [Candidatus Sulfopaludibacter sp.]
MARTNTLASVEIDVADQPQRATPVDPDEPFRILVAGNFSGGSGRNRRLVEIDRDNFDEVMALMAPELRLPFGNVEVAIRFKELDDFHPDQLLAHVPVFQQLRDLRKRMDNPATFDAAVAEMEPRANAPDPKLANVSGADLLAMMTGEAAPARAPEPSRSTWDRMLSEVVGKYATENPDLRRPAWLARIDDAITGEMRVLLHHPEFQALEAAWRGLYFLVRRLETGEELKIYLMDLPQEELTAGTGLADLARAFDGDPLAVVAGLYAFGKSDEAALQRVAALAQNANAPVLAGLSPDVVGIEEVFGDLRSSLSARWIGLALPRFLLRLPYGEATDSAETFSFEEMPTPPQHQRYLWGNPSIALAYLLGEAFTRHGWRMRPGLVQDIDNLPLHVYKVDGASEVKPCAEVLLTETSAELLLDRGFMPLATMKGTDRVRLVRFQSVAKPAKALAGKWE